ATVPMRWPKVTLASSLGVTAAAAIVLLARGAPRFEGDLHALHTEDSPAMRTLADLDRLVDRPLVPWVVYSEGGDVEALNARFAELAQRLEPLVADGTLVSVEPPSRLLPPRADQEAAFAALAGLDADAVVKSLREQAAQIGFGPDALTS